MWYEIWKARKKNAQQKLDSNSGRLHKNKTNFIAKFYIYLKSPILKGVIWCNFKFFAFALECYKLII